MVVMVKHSLPLESSSPLFGTGGSGGHGHLGPSSQELPSSAGKGKGWWSWSYSFLFWKREGAMVMVIHNLLLRRCPPPLGQSEPAQLTTPLLSHMKRNAFQRKAVYDHDHYTFPFQKRRTGQELIWGLFVKKKGLSIYCQSCKAWVGLGEGQPEGPAQP